MYLTKEQTEELINHFKIMKRTMLLNDFKFNLIPAKNKEADGKYDVSLFPCLISKEAAKSSTLQAMLFKFGLENNTPYPKFLEDTVINTHWKSHLLDPYYKFLKSKQYYPEDELSIPKMIANTRYENNKVFWTCIKLSNLIRDNEVCIESYANSFEITRGNYNLPTLEITKFKKYFDKRFESINLNQINDKDSLAVIMKQIARIDEAKESNITEINNLNLVQFTINAETVSQNTNLPLNLIYGQLSTISQGIKSYIDNNSEVTKQLSIDEFRFNYISGYRDKLSFEITFSDISKRETITEIIDNVLSDSIVLINEKELKGAQVVNSRNGDDYFRAFFDYELLKRSMNGSNLEMNEENLKNKSHKSIKL